MKTSNVSCSIEYYVDCPYCGLTHSSKGYYPQKEGVLPDYVKKGDKIECERCKKTFWIGEVDFC